MSAEEVARFVWHCRLGAVVEASANMEFLLRAIFGALLGSPRAQVVAAGQSVAWLAENALAVIDANDEVRGASLGNPEKVARFRAAIASCRTLNCKRDRLFHDAWVEGLPDGRPGLSQLRSRRHQPLPVVREVKLEDIERLADDLNAVHRELMAASLEVKGIISGT